MLETWKDWLSQVASSINSSVCTSTCQSPHFILFGVDKRLPYELLGGTHSPVYNAEDYVKCHLKVFSDIHKSVRSKLQATNTAMCATQHKRVTPVTLQVGDFVMVQVPERESCAGCSWTQHIGRNEAQIFQLDFYWKKSLRACSRDGA